MAIDNDVKITINLNKLVDIRAKLLTQREDYSEKVAKGEFLDENDVDQIASKLRETLTWDTLYYMIDESILDYLDINDNHYGEIANDAWLTEIENNKKQFEMVELSSPSWTIQVPRRKKK